MSNDQYRNRFNAEYERRTGITFDDAGGTDEEIGDYQYNGYTPSQAVSSEIARYDLTDAGV